MVKLTRLSRLRSAVWTQRADSGERGSVVVEAALITPIFIMLLIGVLEFGLAFKDQLAVTSAVRAGARMASAEPRISTLAADAAAQVAREGSALDMSTVQALWVYKADTSGHPIGAGGTFNSCGTSCIKFTWNAGQNQFVPSGGSWLASSQNACHGEQDSVGVYLSIRHAGVTRAIFDALTLTSHTVMSLEPVPSLQAGGCRQ